MEHNSELRGVVLVDFLVFLRSSKLSADINCLQRIVDKIYDVCGVAVSAVGLVAASFTGDYQYEEMLQYVFEQNHKVAYNFLLVISMGNDIYPNSVPTITSMYGLVQRAVSGIRDFLVRARNQFDVIGLVFGGSAEVWQYQGEMGVLYDLLVDDVLNHLNFEDELTYLSSGKDELEMFALKYALVDSIGHFNVLAYPLLEKVLLSWTRDIVLHFSSKL